MVTLFRFICGRKVKEIPFTDFLKAPVFRRLFHGKKLLMTSRDPISLTLFSPEEMAEADRLTIAAGTPGYTLMKRAGAGLASYCLQAFPRVRKIGVFCGPGNNGGDGFLVAQLVMEAGHSVRLGLLGQTEALTGDAARAMADWQGETEPVHALLSDEFDLIIDAVFGAGLSRDVSGEAATLIEALNGCSSPILSVDLPSGIDGRTGQVRGVAIRADASVTFHRKKPGHVLYPGRSHCGRIRVIDIGINEDAQTSLNIRLFENQPSLWTSAFPTADPAQHKYTRGHAVVLSGPEFATGAARLTAKAALRAGAGLVTLAGEANALRIHAAHLTAIMLKPVESPDDLSRLLSDQRICAIALGPGFGVSKDKWDLIDICLASDKALVLDADALTLLSENSSNQLNVLAGRTTPFVLTPHEGEFKRLFPDLAEIDSKVEKARQAAVRARAICVLKGPDTVIAAPDGRAAINTNAPPWLATAGSGDTLAGIITGLVAQGMPAFEAACAGVWLHGEAANRLGRGMTADDLDQGLFDVMRSEAWLADDHG